jgi:hypothetical protein
MDPVSKRMSCNECIFCMGRGFKRYFTEEAALSPTDT